MYRNAIEIIRLMEILSVKKLCTAVTVPQTVTTHLLAIYIKNSFSSENSLVLNNNRESSD